MSFLLSPMRRVAPKSVRAFSTTHPSRLARMTIVGRLGTDPEISESANGNQVIKYVVGSSYGPRDNRQTSWFRVASFAAPESPARGYLMGLTKGTLVYLEGDATMRTYDDADGKKQSALSLVQTKVEVLKRPQPSTEDNAEGGALGV
ncbi:ssDNA-binding protein, mitochondrial [Knufia fluminis]|uniref:SsDNA-binding protein, mitochondrial n=1 Tax=Knufia fluminis TaxID=191047 RepID=A0AAN8EQE2_9EURO|nr:ssDNA-binding protein, mitochondrial [Knufia fluminis]